MPPFNYSARGRPRVNSAPQWFSPLIGPVWARHPGDVTSSTQRQQWWAIAQSGMDTQWTHATTQIAGTYPLLGGNSPQDAGHMGYYDGPLNHWAVAAMLGEGAAGTYKVRGDQIADQYVTYVNATTPGVHQIFPETVLAWYLMTGDSRATTIMGRFNKYWNGFSANQFPDAFRWLGGLSYGSTYGAVTVNGVNASGATTVSLHKVTNAGSVTAGDVIQIGSGPAAGQYTVTANATLVVGNTSVSISPGLLGATTGGEVVTRPSTLFTEGRIVGRYILAALALHKSGVTGSQSVAQGAYSRTYSSPLAVAQDYAAAAIEKQTARGDWNMGSTMHGAQYNFHAAIMVDAMWKLHLYAPDQALVDCIQRVCTYLKTYMFNTGWPYTGVNPFFGQGIVDYSLDSANAAFTVPFSATPVGAGGVGMNIDLGNLFAPMFYRTGDAAFARQLLGTTTPNAYGTSQAKYGHMATPATTFQAAGGLTQAKQMNEFLFQAWEYMP